MLCACVVLRAKFINIEEKMRATCYHVVKSDIY